MEGYDPVAFDRYFVIESEELPHANDDGSITVPDGDEVTLVEYEPVGDTVVYLHALGAADAQGVEYRLYDGQDIAHGTESPVGTINNPFSFTQKLGGPLSTDDLIQYNAVNTSGSDVDLAGRMHVHVPPQE